MKRLKTVFLLILILFLSFIYNTNAQLKVTPTLSIKSGGKGVMAIDINDSEGKVARVTGTAVEYPEYTFELNDKGENGDLKAGDGIWSAELTVPTDAMPAKYLLECSAYDSTGSPVMIKSEGGEEKRLSITFIVNVY